MWLHSQPEKLLVRTIPKVSKIEKIDEPNQKPFVKRTYWSKFQNISLTRSEENWDGRNLKKSTPFFLKKIFLKTWVEYNLNHNHMAQWNLFDLVNNVILKFPANDL